MTPLAIDIRTFGAFRAYGASVALTVPPGTTVAEIKQALTKVLGKQARTLINESVIANSATILPGDYVVNSDEKLAILPPVCGG